MKPLTIAIIATLVVAGAVFGYLYCQFFGFKPPSSDGKRL